MDARIDRTFEHPEFTPLFELVTWKKPNDDRLWTNMYAPSDEVCKWDDAEWATTAIGIFNIHDQNKAAFAYCDVKVTGRKVRNIPGTGGVFHGSYGMKARITFNKGTDDENTFDCWVVQVPQEVN